MEGIGVGDHNAGSFPWAASVLRHRMFKKDYDTGAWALAKVFFGAASHELFLFLDCILGHAGLKCNC